MNVLVRRSSWEGLNVRVRGFPADLNDLPIEPASNSYEPDKDMFPPGLNCFDATYTPEQTGRQFERKRSA